jgi:hypothetical protein
VVADVPQKPNRSGALLGLAACCLLVAASVSPAAAHDEIAGTASGAAAFAQRATTTAVSAPGAATSATILIGAGDICVTSRIDDARATAKLIAAEPDAHVFTLGDNSNEIGTEAQYADCYRAREPLATTAAGLHRDRPRGRARDDLRVDGRPVHVVLPPATGLKVWG